MIRNRRNTALRITALIAALLLMTPLPVVSEDTIQVKSIEQLENEFKEQPQSYDVNYEYCGKLIELKNYPRAVEVCTVAIETGIEQELSWSYLNRGVAYKELGRLADAKRDRESSKQHGMPKWLLDSHLKL